MYSVYGCDICGWPCIYIHTWYKCVFCVYLFTLNTHPDSPLVGPGGIGLQNPHLSQAARSGPVISPDITITSLSVCNFCIYLSTYIFTGLPQYSEIRLCSCAMPEVGLGSSQTDRDLWVGGRLAAGITESPVCSELPY